MPSRLVKGQRCYRECDIAPMLEAARGEELLNEIEVTLLMGGSHFWQLHLLIDFPHVLLADDAQRVPRPDSRGPMGALWKRKSIGPWAEQMRTNAAKMLTAQGAETLPRRRRTAGAAERSHVRRSRPCARHFDQLLAYLQRIRPHEAAFRAAKRLPSRGCDHFSFFLREIKRKVRTRDVG